MPVKQPEVTYPAYVAIPLTIEELGDLHAFCEEKGYDLQTWVKTLLFQEICR